MPVSIESNAIIDTDYTVETMVIFPGTFLILSKNTVATKKKNIPLLYNVIRDKRKLNGKKKHRHICIHNFFLQTER